MATAALLVLLLEGCSGLRHSAAPPSPPPSEEPEATCTPNFELSLTGALGNLLAAGRRAHGLASSRPTPCSASDLEVVESCSTLGTYAYLSAPAEGRTEATEVGRFVGPPIHRSELRGRGCERVTHVVRWISVGSFSGERGCVGGQARPLPGCQTPIRLALSPVLEEPKRPVRMVRIPGGSAVVGAARGSGVRVAPFELDPIEVSVQAYRVCVDAGACRTPLARSEGDREIHRNCTWGRPGADLLPVNCVSWEDASNYCRFKKKRLPSEAEWTMAARGAEARTFVWGEAWPPPSGAGNFSDETALDRYPFWASLEGFVDGFAEAAPVDAVLGDRTPIGVYGLAGNVREWVHDRYGRGSFRVVRGASFGEANRENLRTFRREGYSPSVRSAHIGFRCARDTTSG